MTRKQNEETKVFLTKLRENAKIKSVERKKIYIPPEDRVRKEGCCPNCDGVLFEVRKDTGSKNKVFECEKCHGWYEEVGGERTENKSPVFQEGGQFAPQNARSRNVSKVYSMGRGYGWSEKTILEREGMVKSDVTKPYKDIVEEILVEGHAVKTRAANTCMKCGRPTGAGEIVLGVVHGGYGTGGSDRYYICKDCARKELEG